VNCRNYVSIIIVSTILYKTYTSYDTFINLFIMHTGFKLCSQSPDPAIELYSISYHIHTRNSSILPSFGKRGKVLQGRNLAEMKSGCFNQKSISRNFNPYMQPFFPSKYPYLISVECNCFNHLEAVLSDFRHLRQVPTGNIMQLN
jgi:hypothetical protein